jgi:hypothetical protein
MSANNDGSCARGSEADSSATQCTWKERCKRRTNIAVPEDLSADSATQCTAGALQGAQTNMGSCVRGSEC